MTDLGFLHHSLGLEFLTTPAGTIVTQRGYVRQMLNDAGMAHCNPARTPMIENLHLTRDTGTPPVDHHRYQSMVGQLHFLLQTQNDIQYAVNIVSRFTAAPQQAHLQAVHHLYRYLKGTVDYGLLYRRGEDSTLLGYSDADWAGDREDRKSTTGYLFCLGSTPITWRTHKQPCVALSSTESEYMALSSAAQEATWIRRLLMKLQALDSKAATEIRCDNQSAIRLAENPVFHARTKHIETHHYYIREQVEAEKIKVTHVPSSDQIADIFTKPLGRTAFEKLRDHLGLVCTSHIPAQHT
jgi:hypothetical protein